MPSQNSVSKQMSKQNPLDISARSRVQADSAHGLIRLESSVLTAWTLSACLGVSKHVRPWQRRSAWTGWTPPLGGWTKCPGRPAGACLTCLRGLLPLFHGPPLHDRLGLGPSPARLGGPTTAREARPSTGPSGGCAGQCSPRAPATDAGSRVSCGCGVADPAAPARPQGFRCLPRGEHVDDPGLARP